MNFDVDIMFDDFRNIDFMIDIVFSKFFNLYYLILNYLSVISSLRVTAALGRGAMSFVILFV